MAGAGTSCLALRPLPFKVQPVLSNNVNDVRLLLTIKGSCLRTDVAAHNSSGSGCHGLSKLDVQNIMCSLCSQLWKISGSTLTACDFISPSCRRSSGCPRMSNSLVIDADADVLIRC